MILFVSGATATMRRYPRAGELIVPGAGSNPESLRLVPGRWACDNGAYSKFDPDLFVGMLERFHGRAGCRFVAAPDVVGDAAETLRRWPFWSRLIRGVGFPPALVAQDGLTAEAVPWKEIGALFVGGSTEWKLGRQAAGLMAIAKARGVWVHVGRVNTDRRIWDMCGKGADSIDGSQFSRWPDRWLGRGLAEIDAALAQSRLEF